MRSHELARLLLENPDGPVEASVDVSHTDVDPHAIGRVFGSEILDVICPKGFEDAPEITICFNLEEINREGFLSIARRDDI